MKEYESCSLNSEIREGTAFPVYNGYRCPPSIKTCAPRPRQKRPVAGRGPACAACDRSCLQAPLCRHAHGPDRPHGEPAAHDGARRGGAARAGGPVVRGQSARGRGRGSPSDEPLRGVAGGPHAAALAHHDGTAGARARARPLPLRPQARVCGRDVSETPSAPARPMSRFALQIYIFGLQMSRQRAACLTPAMRSVCVFVLCDRCFHVGPGRGGSFRPPSRRDRARPGRRLASHRRRRRCSCPRSWPRPLVRAHGRYAFAHAATRASECTARRRRRRASGCRHAACCV